MLPSDQHHEIARAGMDLISIGTLVAVFTTWLPPIAALFTILWTFLRIVESRAFTAALWHWFGIDLHKWLQGKPPVVQTLLQPPKVDELKLPKEERPKE